MWIVNRRESYTFGKRFGKHWYNTKNESITTYQKIACSDIRNKLHLINKSN